jgi:hypothetical protein
MRRQQKSKGAILLLATAYVDCTTRAILEKGEELGQILGRN